LEGADVLVAILPEKSTHTVHHPILNQYKELQNGKRQWDKNEPVNDEFQNGKKDF
jgi:hypothetical protein